MAPPYQLTADGFDLQMATNYLGHFALTGLLLDLLLTTAGSRVVTVSSHLHRLGRLDPDELTGGPRRRRWPAYARSKLGRSGLRLRARPTAPCGRRCHPFGGRPPGGGPVEPGGQRAGGRRVLAPTSGRSARRPPQPIDRVGVAPYPLRRHRRRRGGRHLLRARAARSGPGAVSSAAARRIEDAGRLWTASETATGVVFDFGAARSPVG